MWYDRSNGLSYGILQAQVRESAPWRASVGFGLKKCLLVADTIEKTKEEEIEIEKRRLENAEKQ